MNGSKRPFAALQDRAYERAGSARKRSSAEDGGCASRGHSLSEEEFEPTTSGDDDRAVINDADPEQLPQCWRTT